jgi:hypothetical protein
MLRRFTAEGALPLTLALQGTALVLLALFSFSDRPPADARIGNGDLPEPDRPIASELQIPRDLVRERIPVPKFPEPEKPGKAAMPKPAPESPKAPIAPGNKLAALRVSSVALAGLVRMDSPLPIPDAPDSIGLNDMGGDSGRAWLGGNRRTRRGNGGFLGPSGTGGEGGGWGPGPGGIIGVAHGDNCAPGRGGLIARRGRLPVGNASGPEGMPGPDETPSLAGMGGFHR